MTENEKLKIGIYWAASCGGCDVAITHINEKILDLVAVADIVFWPCAMDFKYEDVENMPDGYMDVCLFNGGIRNSDHEHIAKLLRKKSKAIVAYGSCACFGGVPGLSNVTTAAESISRAYLEEPSSPNPDRIVPLCESQADGNDMTLPKIWDTVLTLDQMIKVDYFLPGCPPTPALTQAAVEAIATGTLPPPGSTIAGTKALCDECPREKKSDMRITEFKEPWEVELKEDLCLIEQGIICMGPATRSGCGAQCISVNMPCRGCFGPPQGVADQGAAMLGALASVVQTNKNSDVDPIDGIKDPLGAFYRFSLADSILRRTKIRGLGELDK